MNIPETLQTSLRARKVIPFVGAGVSMSVRHKETDKPLFPSWRELLERAAARLEKDGKTSDASVVRGLLGIARPNYLEAARYAREGMGKADWYKFLKEQLQLDRELVKPETLRLPEAIWKLNSQLVITTNYDDVLRWSAPPNTYPEVWDIEAHAEMAAFLRGEMKGQAVWHLHGRIHNASKMILAPDDYGLLYPEAKEEESEKSYEAALSTLHTLLSTHTFLFIGFSLNDAYFGQQLERIKRIYEGATSSPYVLVHKDQARDVPNRDEIEVITFEDFGERLLERMNELVAIANDKDKDKTPTSKEPQPPQVSIKQTAHPAPHVADYNPNKPVFSVPFRQKGDQVIGREDALQAVRKQLTEGRRTAIGQTAAFQGLGGLGKTQLAVEYAYRFKDSYPNGVIWLNADQDIDAQLTELADKAGWIAPQSEHKYKLDVARNRVRTYSDCLIVFDNLEDAQTIENYLPEPQANPHILVTSRLPQPDFIEVPLESLNEALSFELLTQEAGRKPVEDAEKEAAREISITLGGLPLALELAGAYLRHRPVVSWQQYRDLLRHSPKAALPGRLRTFTKHETDLYSTLKINEEIFEEEPRLKEILDLLTWSGTAPMGQDLMCTLLNVKNPLELTNAFGVGTALRLLQKTVGVASYSIHRLVGEVRREEMPLHERREWVNDICQRIGDWFEKRKDEFSELPHYEAEINHLQAWQGVAEQHAPEHSVRLLWLQVYPSFHRGHNQEIKRWMERVLKLFETGHEIKPKQKADLFGDLGFGYIHFGDYRNGLDYSLKALEIYLEVLGEKHPYTATTFSNVGNAYGYLGDSRNCLEYCQKGLEIRLELFGEKHSDTANSFSSMGGAYGGLGDNQSNLKYSRKALEIRLELFGEKHPDTANSFSSMGSAYGYLGDYKQSLEYFQKALKIRLELFGEKHPNTASSFNSVGSAYGDLDDYQSKLEYSLKGLEIYLEFFGEKHPDTAGSLSNVGNAYVYLGDYRKGLEYCRRGLEIHLELFGEKHPYTINSFNDMGNAYEGLEDYKLGLEYTEKAVKLGKEVLGDKHPNMIVYMGRLVRLLTNLKRYSEASQLLEETLSQLPEDHIHYNWLKSLERTLQSESTRPVVQPPSSKEAGPKTEKEE